MVPVMRTGGTIGWPRRLPPAGPRCMVLLRQLTVLIQRRGRSGSCRTVPVQIQTLDDLRSGRTGHFGVSSHHLAAPKLRKTLRQCHPVMNMASCGERQRLEGECETALNDYIDSLKRSLAGQSDSAERQRVLSACRARLSMHCRNHGCGHGEVSAKSAAAAG